MFLYSSVPKLIDCCKPMFPSTRVNNGYLNHDDPLID